jgi:hypothetical protein
MQRINQQHQAPHLTSQPHVVPAPGIFDDDASFEQQLAAASRQQRQARLRRLQQLYGPHFSDSDVRLYLKKRSLNNDKVRQYRKGGLPLDDSLPKPGTLTKFPEAVKAIICEWL